MMILQTLSGLLLADEKNSRHGAGSSLRRVTRLHLAVAVHALWYMLYTQDHSSNANSDYTAEPSTCGTKAGMPKDRSGI